MSVEEFFIRYVHFLRGVRFCLLVILGEHSSLILNESTRHSINYQRNTVKPGKLRNKGLPTTWIRHTARHTEWSPGEISKGL